MIPRLVARSDLRYIQWNERCIRIETSIVKVNPIFEHYLITKLDQALVHFVRKEPCVLARRLVFKSNVCIERWQVFEHGSKYLMVYLFEHVGCALLPVARRPSILL